MQLLLIFSSIDQFLLVLPSKLGISDKYHNTTLLVSVAMLVAAEMKKPSLGRCRKGTFTLKEVAPPAHVGILLL